MVIAEVFLQVANGRGPGGEWQVVGARYAAAVMKIIRGDGIAGFEAVHVDRAGGFVAREAEAAAIPWARLIEVLIGHVVWVVPITRRIIAAHFQTALGAAALQLRDDIAFGARTWQREVGVSAVEEAVAIVVLGGQHHAPHPCHLSKIGPAAGIEMLRILVHPQLTVVLVGDACQMTSPLRAPAQRFALPPTVQTGVRPPMDEQAEFGIAPPIHLAGGVGERGQEWNAHGDRRYAGPLPGAIRSLRQSSRSLRRLLAAY